MANIKACIAGIAAIVALAFPASAAARGLGGGGGGLGGGGGGHFGGGGGMHFGGGMPSFGGGGMPSFGGGGMHGFGGGGMRGFGGGAMHFSAPSLVRPSFGGGAMHSFARPTFSAGAIHSFARPGLSAGGTRSFLFSGGTRIHASRSSAGLHAGSHGFSARDRGLGGVGGMRSASRVMGSASAIGNARGAWAARSWRTRLGAAGAVTTGAVLARAGAAHWTNGGHWHDHADWHRHRGFFGWVGPVFWPWFYDDLYDCVFWDYGPSYYDDPFWAYGYGDIYGAIFSPYGYDELVDWAPSRGRVARRNPASEPGARSQEDDARQPAQPTQWSAMCGDDAREVANLPIDRISAAVSPDEQQRAALDALANASVQAAQAVKAACPTDLAFTPTGRLDAMERRVDAMVQAVALIRPPLESFYGMLSDEQKARFNTIGQGSRERHGALTSAQTQGCGPNNLVPEWQQARIEKLVRPSEGQHVLLDRLRDATQQAADMLKAVCPAEPPASPPARLAALATRLDTMLKAVRLVHTPLNDFYNSLSDEQKAQFNRIPPVVQVGQQRG